MKKITYTLIVFSLTISFGLSGCFSTKALFGTKYLYTFKLLGDNARVNNTFDDGKIRATFVVGAKQLEFTMMNLTTEPMKINWDEASLIIYGESKRIMHKGVKYIDRNAPQAPTVIPGNASIDDLVAPTDNVYYKEGYYGTYTSSPGGWEQTDLFLSNDLNKEDTKKLILDSKGQTFKFFLPIEQEDKKVNYTFEFQIADVIPVTKH
jgi:hypothetical protein